MSKLLSIIIPTYNMENFLRKCLDSLLIEEQEMEQVEVLVINDGSVDASSSIAHEYESRYPHTFKVIDKKNGGHGSAWNVGLELAEGKYIRFLDSDDWLTNLDSLISVLKTTDVDVVCTDLRMVFMSENREKVFKWNGIRPNNVYNADTFDWQITNQIYNGEAVTNFHLCTYKTEMLKRFHPIFLEKQSYDDEILYVLPIIAAHTFIYVDFVLYNYLIGREGQSIDPKIYVRNLGFKWNCRKYMQEFVDKHSLGISEHKQEKISYILNQRNFIMMRALSLLPYGESKAQTKQFIEWLTTAQPDYCRTLIFKMYSLSFPLYWLSYHVLRGLWTDTKTMIKRIIYK